MSAVIDLQGVGAVASALVAFIGIPAAVLVGRAQTQAAVRAAELGAEAGQAQARAAAEAGIAQAEATYRAALDATRDQARAEYRQWRHTLRREAWATFASKVHEAMTAAADLVNRAEPHEDFDGLKSACMAAGRAIQFSCAVVELEGPVPVAELAGRVYEGIISLQLRANEAALVERAIHILRAVENEQGLAGIDLDDVLDAWDALHDLSTAARAQATAGSYPIRTAGARNAVLAEAAARALTTLASCGVVGDGASSLINDARQGLAPDNRQNAFHEAGTEVQRRLATWIEAARVYLDSDGLA